MSASSRIWQKLRATRAHPPARAAQDAQRSGVYRSALEQFEELMRAAEAVGPAARPLPLFYALSQAGRAIAAARGDVFLLRSHGLAMNRDEQPPLLERLINPRPSSKYPDSFGHVARAIGSDSLTGSVSIGELWRANPDLGLSPAPRFEQWRRPLYVMHQEQEVAGVSFLMSRRVETRVIGLPDAVAGDDTMGALAEELRGYPGTDGFQLNNPVALIRQGEWGWSARVMWEADGTDAQDRRRKVDEIAPEHRITDRRWLIPRVGANADALSPLMLWWGLLFGLSNLARYEPNVWMEALALNASQLAVPLGAVLDEGLQAVPHLVLDALLADRHLVPRAEWALN